MGGWLPNVLVCIIDLSLVLSFRAILTTIKYRYTSGNMFKLLCASPYPGVDTCHNLSLAVSFITHKVMYRYFSFNFCAVLETRNTGVLCKKILSANI